MIWVGLTGGIASGKSTVGDLFRKSNYVVVDADLIVHQLLKPDGLAFHPVKAHFGASILSPTGEIDRKKLGAVVFGRPQKLVELEKILHPLVRAEALAQKNQAKVQGATLAFYEVPLLFEKKLQGDFDYVVVVSCSENKQLERLQTLRGLSKEEAQARISLQIPLAEKVNDADFVIQNDGDLEELKTQVAKILVSIKNA